MNENIEQLREVLARARQEVGKVIIGQTEVVDLLQHFRVAHWRGMVCSIARFEIAHRVWETIGCQRILCFFLFGHVYTSYPILYTCPDLTKLVHLFTMERVPCRRRWECTAR